MRRSGYALARRLETVARGAFLTEEKSIGEHLLRLEEVTSDRRGGVPPTAARYICPEDRTRLPLRIGLVPVLYLGCLVAPRVSWGVDVWAKDAHHGRTCRSDGLWGQVALCCNSTFALSLSPTTVELFEDDVACAASSAPVANHIIGPASSRR